MLIRHFEVYFSRKAIMARLVRKLTGVDALNVGAVSHIVFRDNEPMSITVFESALDPSKIRIRIPVRLIHEFLVPDPEKGPDAHVWRTVGGKWILTGRQGEYMTLALKPPHGWRNEELLHYIIDEAVACGQPDPPASDVWIPRKLARKN